MKFQIKNRLQKQRAFLRRFGRGWVISNFLEGYWVSKCGKIASMLYPVGSMRELPLILKQRTQKNGYKTIAYKGKNYLVHRLVAREFLGCVHGKIVHHKDSLKGNNGVENLEITTTSKNNKSSYKKRNSNKKILTESIRFYREKHGVNLEEPSDK